MKAKNVLVTRQVEQATHLINCLSRMGHHPFLLPMIETIQLCPQIEEGEYEVILFTSANAVKYFAPYNNSVRAKIYIAVGEKTQEAVRTYLQITQVMIPSKNNLEGAMDIISSLSLKGKMILSPGAKDRLPIPKERLDEMGADLYSPIVYETAFIEYPKEHVESFLKENRINAITFCSPSAAKAFYKQCRKDTLCEIYSIGSTTAKYLESIEVESSYPEHFTAEAMAALI